MAYRIIEEIDAVPSFRGRLPKYYMVLSSVETKHSNRRVSAFLLNFGVSSCPTLLKLISSFFGNIVTFMYFKYLIFVTSSN